MSKEVCTKQEIKQLLEKGTPILFLDVRDEAKFQTGSVESKFADTRNVPYVHMLEQGDKPLDEETERAVKERQIITVCTTGNKAQKAAALLREHGFEAKALLGGLTAWKDDEDEAK